MSRHERLQKRVGQKLAKRVMSQTNFTPNNPSAGNRRKTASPSPPRPCAHWASASSPGLARGDVGVAAAPTRA